MTRKYWLPIIALAGFLASTQIALSQESSAPPTQPQPQSKTTESARQIEQSAATAHIPASPLVYQPDCERPQKNEDADYCEQRSMAWSAAEVVFWTRWQFWVSLFGLGGLLGSLWLNRVAVKAAQESVTVAQNTANSELRAYIGVEYQGCAEVIKNNEYSFGVIIKNHGQTPALNVSFDLPDAKPLATGQAFDFPDAPVKTKDLVLPPGDSIFGGNVTCKAVVEDGYDLVRQGKNQIYVFGIVRYDDVFGAPHFTRYRFKITGPEFDIGGHVKSHNGNNTDQSRQTK